MASTFRAYSHYQGRHVAQIAAKQAA